MTQSDVASASEAEGLLQTLELPEFTGGQGERFDDAEAVVYSGDGQAKTATVVKNRMLLVSDPKLTAEQQSDVDLSTLLAQANSDKRYDQETQMPEWYRNYKQVMGKLCYWTIHGLEFQEYKSSEATFSLNSVALEVLEQIVRNLPNAAAIRTTVADAINKLVKLAEKGDPRANIFGRGHDGDQAVKLAIGYAYPGQSGPRIVMSAFYFKADKNVTNLLVAKWRTQETRVWYSSAEMEQSTALFTKPQPKSGKPQRELLRIKLGKAAEDELNKLEI
ncbi:hypothetical protein [Actinomadura rudentiformis]|uniref:Uncharacterized protein n=1 Tax=Actinomadura rudentiformis TaxID=359158 RepID=A0A6H9Z199_9ACTN|nr:hypothetical protein [Actinomadura rudentiformis]KAB2346905.1 hypothetical protein F8566_22170 [Actinomadura rudentiformis]